MALLLPAAFTLPAAASTTQISATGQVSQSLSTALPVLRLHFAKPIDAQQLPELRIQPQLRTKWLQVGPSDVQAVITGRLHPATSYEVDQPMGISCASSCQVTNVKSVRVLSGVDYTWEAQLLAELNYLPVSFSPAGTSTSQSQETPGIFSWKYPSLPSTLSSQWTVGANNVILRGALMNFQSVNNLPTTGVADAATWTALMSSVDANKVDPASYNYVDVSEASPETLTLYVGGAIKMKALVNTGIPVAPTALGTYPVYLRLTSQTMSGTNPDGSHYRDAGIPWISYFNGGDALHGFIRYSYGSPQSLGCVEMPFATAKVVWPFTPIGTLVTVR